MNKSTYLRVFVILGIFAVFLFNINKMYNLLEFKDHYVYAGNISISNSVQTDNSIPSASMKVEGNNLENANTPGLLYVGEGQQYLSVQDAVYYANEGDTVFIKAGTYSECIKINKNYITIVGEGINTTCIENDSGDTVIDIYGTKGVIIKGLTIKSARNCIDVRNSDECSIVQCKIEAKLCGITAGSNSENILINECDISGIGKGYGVKISSNRCSIINCDIYNHEDGVFISSSIDVLVEKNRINNHKYTGCKLVNVSKFVCVDNNISSNSMGIVWDVSSDQVKTNGEIINNELFFNRNKGIDILNVCDVVIKNNYLYTYNEKNWANGMRIWLKSSNNTITHNIVSNYRYGIILDYYSRNNSIYWNDFICYDAVDNSQDQSNTWDMESRGNYWSDYSGEDKNEDGIGDIPYVLKPDFSNTDPVDNYPLMNKQYTVIEPNPLPTAAPTVTPTLTAVPTTTATPTVTPTSTAVPTTTATPTATPTPTLTAVPTTTATPTATLTATPTAAPAPTPSKNSPVGTPNGSSQGKSTNTIEFPSGEIPAAVATDTTVPSPIKTPMPVEPVTVPGYLLTDTNNHWAKEYIDLVVSKGIMMGKGESVFAPDDYTTRAECAKVTTALLRKVLKDTELNRFSDVSREDWFYNYVYSAYNEGIMIGNPDGTFSPNTPVTRQDLAVIFSKVLVKYYSFNPVKALNNRDDLNIDPYSNLDVVELKGMIELPFNDVDSISEYAMDGVATASNYGLFSGKPGNLFDPKGNTTRAELATILYKLITKYGLVGS